MEDKSGLSHSTIDCKQQKKASILKCQNAKITSDDVQKPGESSMVSQLHNQGQDQFALTCNNCESTVETRFHCAVCGDFDLCIECYNKEGHVHEMQRVEFELGGDSNGGDQEQFDPQLSLNIQLIIRSLEHACQCRHANCRLRNCQKMKRLVSHAKICKRKWDGSCKICKQIIVLSCYHAQECQETNCPVPFCLNINYTLRQVQAAVVASQTAPYIVARTGLPSHPVGMRPQYQMMAANNNPNPADPFLVQPDSPMEESDSALEESDSALEDSDSALEELDPPLEESDLSLEEPDSQAFGAVGLSRVMSNPVTSTSTWIQQRSNKQVLQQVLISLKFLNYFPEQKQRIRNILKSNPLLMAAFIQQRSHQLVSNNNNLSSNTK